jgi:hypothetical protein
MIGGITAVRCADQRIDGLDRVQLFLAHAHQRSDDRLGEDGQFRHQTAARAWSRSAIRSATSSMPAE